MAESQEQKVYKTEASAKMIQGKKSKAGVETEIKPVDGGFILEEIGAQSAGSTSAESTATGQQEARQQRPTGRKSREERLAEKRKKRKNLQLRQVLDARIPPGFVGYWELDNEKMGGSRLQKRLARGWEFVYDKNPSETTGDVGRGSQMGSAVTRPAGNGGTLYLMVIEQELYDEDMRAYNAKLDETEKELEEGPKLAREAGITGAGLQMSSSKPEVRSED